MKSTIFLFLFVLLSKSAAHGQVTTSYSVTGTGVTLEASMTGPASATSVGLTGDNSYSAAIPIGFAFNFYGTDYTHCVVGTNGIISFNISNAFGPCPWAITAPFVGDTSMRNVICGAWTDALISGGGSIFHYTDGIAPNRKFVVTFCGISLYSCTTKYLTSSIVLYETSNLIDIYVGHRDNTCAWNSGSGVEGIQNATATAATVVPGRDFPSSWSASGDAYRFTPTSVSSYTVAPIPYTTVPYPASAMTIHWYEDATGAYVGSGSPLYVPSLASVTYNAVFVACRDSSLSVPMAVLSPCSGTPGVPVVSSNTSTACISTSILLSATWAVGATGQVYQWQSSPDSLAWTDIAGATSASHAVSGIPSTTFYRIVTTCVASGGTSTSAGIRINYTPVCDCSGTPVAGIAAASTTLCSSCSLVLSLSGSTASPGINYQWQRSANGTTGWSNIAGATSVPYAHIPTDAYYYRCNVTCSSSGFSSVSTTVFVSYAYHIIEDSILVNSDSSCGTRFFVRVNGTSPMLSLRTFYGDAQHDSISLTVAGTSSYSSEVHNYSTPGSYYVKQILYCDNIPLDSIVHTYEHQLCRIVPVKLYLDGNGNCTKDATEPYNSLPLLVSIDSNAIPIDAVSVTSGFYYRMNGPDGTVYSFRVLPGGLVASCPVSGVQTVTVMPTATVYSVVNFGLSCSTGSLLDLSINAVVPVTGRRDQWGHVYMRNNYCLPIDATVTLRYSYKYSDHAEWRLTPSSWVAPVITWNLPAVTTGSAPVDLYFVGWAPYSALLTAGDTVVEEITVTPNSGSDCDVTNNHIIRVDTVKASCDPNMIEVLPAGCFDTATRFQFTVHFENTGNDTAHNVYVLDTLSPYLDAASIEMVMSSAEVMNVYPYTEGGYNIVKFDFPNIKLLDSSWHGLNDGAFIYNIKRKAAMAEGASIFSRVGIYFDYNDVVMTNTVQNLKGCPVTAVSNVADVREVLLYPNPAADELTIKTQNGVFTSLSVTNAVGQELHKQRITGSHSKVDVSKLPAGVYYVTLKGEQGSEVRKFVKW